MLSRSCHKLRYRRTHHNVYYKRYCATLAKNNSEYEVTFYSRPFGLDFQYNEFNDEISIRRAAWKDIQMNSVLHRINGKSVKECISDDCVNDASDENEIHNTFKDTIKYLQTCALPTKIIFKLNENIESQTFSSLVMPFLELPNKSLFEMSNEEFVSYLQTNWLKQRESYNKFHSNPVFKQKYSIFLSLFDTLQQNIKDFNKIGAKLKGVPELNGKILSQHTINKDTISKLISGVGSTGANTNIQNPQATLLSQVQTEITLVLDILDEINLEKIECRHLFETLFGRLLFDQIIHVTQEKHTINTHYLYANKERILSKLCALIPNLAKINTQKGVLRTVNKYFENDYGFMKYQYNIHKFYVTKPDEEKVSEYWFIVTLLNDICLFPNRSLKQDSTVESVQELNEYSEHIFSVCDIPLYPHSFKQIQQLQRTDNGNMEIEHIPSATAKQGQYSLRDRLNHFECDLLEMQTLKAYILGRHAFSESDKHEIEAYLSRLPLKDLNKLQLQLEERKYRYMNMERHAQNKEDNMDNFDIYLDHLCIWIYNIVEILRTNCNKEHELFNYLAKERPKYLMKNDTNQIRQFSNSEFIHFITAKISEMGEDNQIFYRTKDSFLSMLSVTQWNGKQFLDSSMEQLLDAMECSNDEMKQCIHWLYSEILHKIHRIDTPIFDEMMEQRKSLKHSLLNTSTESADLDICSEFIELKSSVDTKLRNKYNPLWFQFSDKFENDFAQKFLNMNGFEQHSSKFESMSCLSKLRKTQLKKMELCAKHRKQLMKTVNKWNEIQNIIKYGNEPYYRSNGYDRSAVPSFKQCYGELAPFSNRDTAFDPATDQTKVTKMFYAPFIHYGDLEKMVKYRRFNPPNLFETLEHSETKS